MFNGTTAGRDLLSCLHMWDVSWLWRLVLPFWEAVIIRAFWDTWRTVVNWTSASNGLAAVVPVIFAGIIYLVREGSEPLRRDFIKPLAYAIAGTGVFAGLLFGVKLLTVPVSMYEEAKARARSNSEAVSASPVSQASPLTPVEAAELVHLRGRVKDLEARQRDLEKQLADKKAHKAFLSRLTAQSAELTLLAKRCREVPPDSYRTTAEATIQRAVDTLMAAGLENDALRVSQGSPPMGLPRMVAPNCEPYTANSQVSFALGIRSLVIQDIVTRLGG